MKKLKITALLVALVAIFASVSVMADDEGCHPSIDDTSTKPGAYDADGIYTDGGQSVYDLGL